MMNGHAMYVAWLPSRSLFVLEAGASFPAQRIVQKEHRIIADDVPRVSGRVMGTSMYLHKYHIGPFFVFHFVFLPY